MTLEGFFQRRIDCCRRVESRQECLKICGLQGDALICLHHQLRRRQGMGKDELGNTDMCIPSSLVEQLARMTLATNVESALLGCGDARERLLAGLRAALCAVCEYAGPYAEEPVPTFLPRFSSVRRFLVMDAVRQIVLPLRSVQAR